ncbi:MAG: sodium-dependent transporter [Cellvibrionales bacterium]|nr:sodium-dependent transporter [Cellvibrionales bacterium]
MTNSTLPLPPRNAPTWSSRLTFILAATGSAVGLGNIWKFPYITGENGGGAFVLVYLLCILLAGIPVMIAEVLLGKQGRSSPVFAVQRLALEAGRSRHWRWLGALGVVAGVLILSYYSVIAGWALAYLPKMLAGDFVGIAGDGSSAIFKSHLARPAVLLGWHSLFMVMTMAVVIAGVTRGLGRAVEFLMPVLFVLLLILLGFAIAEGEFMQAVRYLFSFDNAAALTGKSVLIALGHAFFTLSIGMGAIMAYGSYMPPAAPVARTVWVVAVMDTCVALVAGLAIFPIVFASPDLDPASGPGLLFVSLPVAFGGMPAGVLFGTLFFALVSVAAWTSSISLIEPAVAWLVDSGRARRWQAGVILGVLCWAIGVGSVLSFNDWQDWHLLGGFNWFELSDFLTANLMLPLGGILMAIFVGHLYSTQAVRKALDIEGWLYRLWHFVLRWVSPVLVAVVLVYGLIGVFT